MSRRGGILAASLLLGCASPKAAPPPSPIPRENLEVIVSEAIDNPERDAMAYARIFLDGAEAGRTPIARRSEAKRWAGRAEPGNRPLRVEYWLLPGVGEWVKLDDQWQAPERFVRVRDDSMTRVRVRFSDGARRLDFSMER